MTIIKQLAKALKNLADIAVLYTGYWLMLAAINVEAKTKHLNGEGPKP